jgi:hypothetical protein
MHSPKPRFSNSCVATWRTACTVPRPVTWRLIMCRQLHCPWRAVNCELVSCSSNKVLCVFMDGLQRERERVKPIGKPGLSKNRKWAAAAIRKVQTTLRRRGTATAATAAGPLPRRPHPPSPPPPAYPPPARPNIFIHSRSHHVSNLVFGTKV